MSNWIKFAIQSRTARSICILTLIVFTSLFSGSQAAGSLHAALANSLQPQAAVVGDGTPASCTNQALADALAVGGLISFNCGLLPHTIPVTTLIIDDDMQITLDGNGRISLDGSSSSQIFQVLDGGQLTLRNLSLLNGSSGNGAALYNNQGGLVRLSWVTISDCQAGSGGAIYNLGNLDIQYSALTGNSANFSGGAIYNSGSLSISHSQLSANHATHSGGAILNSNGTLTIQFSTLNANTSENGGGISQNSGTTNLLNSLLTGNDALFNGGGIENLNGNLNLTNLTFSANLADRGGGMHNSGQATLTNLTFQANRAEQGGALFNDNGANSVLNSIFSGSLNRDGSAPSLNCDGPTLLSEGYNIVSDGSCILVDIPGDQRNTDPLLGGLQANGGPTLTHFPASGSPAINQGSNTGCPAVDQRGGHRPAGLLCDIGAVETSAPLPRAWLPLAQR
jgi:predicted outer membrane repeat protein